MNLIYLFASIDKKLPDYIRNVAHMWTFGRLYRATSVPHTPDTLNCAYAPRNHVSNSSFAFRI